MTTANQCLDKRAGCIYYGGNYTAKTDVHARTAQQQVLVDSGCTGTTHLRGFLFLGMTGFWPVVAKQEQ